MPDKRLGYGYRASLWHCVHRGHAVGVLGERTRLAVVAAQHLQDALHVALDPALARVPLAARDERREGGNLEVVLHVDGEGVGDRRREHGRLSVRRRGS